MTFQKMVLQKNTRLRRGYLDSPLKSGLPYLTQVRVIPIFSLHTRLLQMQNGDITFWSFDLGYNLFLLALVR